MFISFLFLSEERRKKRTKERRKKRVRSYREKSSRNTLRVLGFRELNPSTYSHFRCVEVLTFGPDVRTFLKRGHLLFPKENYQTFCDIDALAVSMSEKFLRSFFLKSAYLLFSENELYLSPQTQRCSARKRRRDRERR